MRRRDLALALLLALPSTGCVVVAAAGVGAAATYGVISVNENHVTREFEHPLDETWTATVHAFKAQDYEVIEASAPDEPGAEIRVARANVRIEPASARRTRVSVRVGHFKSESNLRQARLVLEEVARRLGE